MIEAATAQVLVSNVMKGTVMRIDLAIAHRRRRGSGRERYRREVLAPGNAAAFVLGPTASPMMPA